MEKTISLGKDPELFSVFPFSEQVITEQGRMYYRIPFWFDINPLSSEIRMHLKEPEDLSEFICKAGLGGPNPQIKKPVL